MITPTLINALNDLSMTGFKAPVVYDIGACTGEWTKTVQENTELLRNSTFYLFEANPAYAEALSQLGHRHITGTVLSTPNRKEVDFYNGTNTGDSYYKERTTHYDNQSTIKLPCATLDEIVWKHDLRFPNFVKLDTQGSELDILSGANTLFVTCELIQIEMPIIKYNEGAPNIQDYLDFFKAKDFVPIEVVEINRAEGIILQLDMLFMKHAAKIHYLGKEKTIRV